MIRVSLLISCVFLLSACGPSGGFASSESDLTAEVSTKTVATDETLSAREQIARDMVTPQTPGTPVMPSGLARIDSEDYSKELARFIPIELGMDRYAVIDELRLYYGADASVSSRISSTEQQVDDDLIVMFRRSGLEDDSVAAEETFARFTDDMLIDFGSRIQCYRGENANEWTTDLCP